MAPSTSGNTTYDVPQTVAPALDNSWLYPYSGVPAASYVRGPFSNIMILRKSTQRHCIEGLAACQKS